MGKRRNKVQTIPAFLSRKLPFLPCCCSAHDLQQELARLSVVRLARASKEPPTTVSESCGSVWVRCPMPRKKKPRLWVGKEARRRARLGIGMPPPERTIPDKRQKPPKHRKSPLDLGEQ